jgi:hypothetical protein
MSQPVVCRRVLDTKGDIPMWSMAVCSMCQENIYVESGDEDLEPKVCLPCAVQHHPNAMIFVELPPDEYGRSSLGKGVKEVFEAQEGEWHQHGQWHSQQWALRNQE